ncbi:SDR family oxidoreductase [Actinorugispora endophytica]|uniref:Short-subunit dehydrogenase n=1 Tax=Actinorugispora endophytica TaxID=1605990 RepID=A0A4R6V1Q8_9ACTN|nr:SDR family oxidoreductase [Actinorugispora endophytica]TDQ49994.1 short-subunit dehydrogenase [Actinorugispora endophytica]
MGRPFIFPGRTIVVTGGANGIGYALAERFLAEGAARVVIADLDGERAEAAAAGLGGSARGCALDVTDPAAVAGVIDAVEREGPIDLWCSNAGVGTGGGLGSADEWDVTWRLHVQAHVHVARLLIPRMVERGSGHLLVTASAAGLVTNIDSAPYSVTKHGAVALAEWLAIRHGDEGVDVSCLCPLGVNTAMTADDGPDAATRLGGDYLEPADVAESVVAALTEGRFLILPQPQAAVMEQRRASDRDRWLSGMRRARARLRSGS